MLVKTQHAGPQPTIDLRGLGLDPGTDIPTKFPLGSWYYLLRTTFESLYWKLKQGRLIAPSNIKSSKFTTKINQKSCYYLLNLWKWESQSSKDVCSLKPFIHEAKVNQTSYVDPNENYGLWMTMTFSHCKTCPTLVRDTGHGGGWACVGAEGVWETSLPSPWYCYWAYNYSNKRKS